MEVHWFCSMNNSLKYLALFITALILSGCDAVLQSPVLTPDVKIAEDAQTDFEVVERDLTMQIARESRNAPYPRLVSRTGFGSAAGTVSEYAMARASYPPTGAAGEYRIGVGDELVFAQLTEPGIASIRDFTVSGGGEETGGSYQVRPPSDQPKLMSSTGRVGSDGSVLLLGLGSIDALGRTLAEVRDEARNVLVRNGVAPNFQLEITRFNSQKVFVMGPGGGAQLPITDRGLTIREVLANGSALRGVNASANTLVRIKIQRGGTEYKFLRKDILRAGQREIYLRDGDQIVIEVAAYQPGKVYVIGGGVSPALIPIDPSRRETLADVLFSPRGVFGSSTAQRSQVYLIRGTNPVEAMKLDLTDPTRLLVASKMELRPNDIIFTPEQPLSSFNRFLLTATPLRLLVRDVVNQNIP